MRGPLPIGCGNGVRTHVVSTGRFRHPESVGHANVSRHPHFGDIESFEFGRRIGSKSDDEIDHLEDDKTKSTYRDHVRPDADALRYELGRVAIEQTSYRSGNTVPAIPVGSVCEQAQCQTTPGAVKTMHGNST